MISFERLGTVSHPIVHVAVSCIISEIKRDIERKSGFFHTPCIQRRRCIGGPCRNVSVWKTRMAWLRDCEMRVTYRWQIDGRTDILRQHRVVRQNVTENWQGDKGRAGRVRNMSQCQFPKQCPPHESVKVSTLPRASDIGKEYRLMPVFGSFR